MPIRFQVDGDFYDHPKSIDLSDAATALWVRAGSYSASKLLDGFVPENMLSRLSRSPEEASGELVARGLWRRVKGGFRFHQWTERGNLTRARVEADREYDRTRKQRERKTAQANGTPQVSQANVRSGHPPDSGPDIERNPNRSVSVSVSESVSGSGRGAEPPPAPPPHGDQEPPPRCEKHLDNPDPPPCGGCAEARKVLARWQVARAARVAKAPKCRIHRGQLAHNCGLCRADALTGSSP